MYTPISILLVCLLSLLLMPGTSVVRLPAQVLWTTGPAGNSGPSAGRRVPAAATACDGCRGSGCGAALYARYSTDKQNPLAVDDHVARSRQYISMLGLGDVEFEVLQARRSPGNTLAARGSTVCGS
jgi:hypothetical protein